MNGAYSGPDSLKVGRPRHLLTDDARAEIRAAVGTREISDECAVTIASWWAGHRCGDGSAMAELSTSGNVSLERLGDDLSGLLRRVTDADDVAALGALATWALNHPTRATRHAHADYPHRSGSLYDCLACELGPCVCTDGEGCVSDHCEHA